MSEDRISKQEMFMQMAEVVAKRSTCGRRVQVGAVVGSTDLTRVLGIGYNGPHRGAPHTCPATAGSCGCVHAEANALIKAGYEVEGTDLFLTLEPCVACAKLVANSRIRRVWFREAYRDHAGRELLVSAGIRVAQLFPDGSVIEWAPNGGSMTITDVNDISQGVAK
jgi:dCMP deaminase